MQDYFSWFVKILAIALYLAVFPLTMAAAKESGEEPIAIEADNANYYTFEDVEVLNANGSVVVNTPTKSLFSDKLSYYKNTERIDALGDVKMLINDTKGKMVMFSQSAKVGSNLVSGLSVNTISIINNSLNVMAKRVIKENDDIIIFEDNQYSACPLPKKFFKNVIPSKSWVAIHQPWSLSSKTMVYDRNAQLLKQKSATFKLYGVPLMYMPKLSIDVGKDKKGRSGFLTPSLHQGNLQQIGVNVPVYWRIAPNKDLTFTPTFFHQFSPMTNVARKFNNKYALEYRHLLKEDQSYQINASTSDTPAPKRGENTITDLSRNNEWYINSLGKFKINDKASFNYNFERASSPNYLLRYENKYVNYFQNEFMLNYLTKNSFSNGGELLFQPIALRNSVYNQTIPKVTLLQTNHFIHHKNEANLDSNFVISANLLNISRNDGYNTQRASVEGNYNLTKTIGFGLVSDSKISMRGDYYNFTYQYDQDNVTSYNNRSASLFGLVNKLNLEDVQQGRVSRPSYRLMTGLKLPLIAYTKNRKNNFIITPQINFVHSPSNINSKKIFNEDSGNSQISYFNLFSGNRTTGLDRIEEGTRMNYGLENAWKNVLFEARMGIGRSYLLPIDKQKPGNDFTISESSGIYQGNSDWVFFGNLSFLKGLVILNNESRMYKHGFQPWARKFVAYKSNNSIWLNLAENKYNLGVTLTRIDKEASNNTESIKIISYNAVANVKRFKFYANVSKDLIPKQKGGTGDVKQRPIMQTFGLFYTGCCVDYNLEASKNFISAPGAATQTKIKFAFTIKGF